MRLAAVVVNLIAWASLRPRFVYEEHRWLLCLGPPRTARNAEDEVTRCAGRSTTPHPSTVMVDGRCPVCGENESERCRFVVGHQHGEPVMCGAVKSIHGDGLGMARHEFVPPRPSTQVT